MHSETKGIRVCFYSWGDAGRSPPFISFIDTFTKVWGPQPPIPSRESFITKTHSQNLFSQRLASKSPKPTAGQTIILGGGDYPKMKRHVWGHGAIGQPMEDGVNLRGQVWGVV